LANDLKDERPEGVKRRKLLQPSSRPKVGPRVNELRHYRIGFPKILPRLGIGQSC
jgi:hypothetical protein